jgi:hypothetical protein
MRLPNHQPTIPKKIMKTIPCILIAMLAGGTLMAEEAKPKPERGERTIPPAVLKEFDKDGDGKLSPEERELMHAAMEERRKARHEAMLKRFDADADGKLSPEERKTAHETIRKEMLAKYDANSNGELEPDERKAMVEGERGNPLAPFMKRPGGPRGPRGEGGPGGEGGPRPERRPRPEAPAE